ncbi:MAG: hypothetical protein ACRCUS_00720 [Anaerovoracaceae bacterium]
MKKRIILLSVFAIVIALVSSAAIAASVGKGISKSSKKDFVEAKAEKLAPKYKKGEAIVLLKGKSNSSSKAIKANFENEASYLAKDVRVENKWDGELMILKVRSKSLSTKELVNKLNLLSGVKYAEPNYLVKKSATPDKYFANYQWSLENNGMNNGPASTAIAADKTDINYAAAKTKDIKITGEKVVAIIDSGIDLKHEDLEGRLWENE